MDAGPESWRQPTGPPARMQGRRVEAEGPPGTQVPPEGRRRPRASRQEDGPRGTSHGPQARAPLSHPHVDPPSQPRALGIGVVGAETVPPLDDTAGRACARPWARTARGWGPADPGSHRPGGLRTRVGANAGRRARGGTGTREGTTGPGRGGSGGGVPAGRSWVTSPGQRSRTGVQGWSPRGHHGWHRRLSIPVPQAARGGRASLPVVRLRPARGGRQSLLCLQPTT